MTKAEFGFNKLDQVKDREYWDDLRFPAAGLKPPGNISDPSLDADSGLLVFAGNSTNMMAGLAQMPHSWAEGTHIEPHVHWVQPGPGDVVWQLDYRLMPAIGAAFPPEWTTVTSTDARSTYPGSGDWVQITAFPDIDMTGYEISAMVLFRLSRLGGDAADTLGDIRLLEFDIHYMRDLPGSLERYVKR